MTLQLELYQFLMLLIAVIGALVGTVKVLWSQTKANLDQQFKSQAENQKNGFDLLERKLAEVAKNAEAGQADVRKLERDFLEFKADLPTRYVAREDYIRGQTVIEAKLDAVFAKLETVQIRQGVGNGNGRSG